MSNCFRKGGCGPYENRSCNECPASKPEYKLKQENIDIYVAILNGEVKDNYMTIGFSEQSAKQSIIDLYFSENGHTENELSSCGIYISITAFVGGKTTNIS
jgi:hypothetical protein